jgi:hypothetical protein
MLAIMDADLEERKRERKAHQEKLRAIMKVHTASLASRIDVHHEKMMAYLGKTEATDLKANPEEMQSEAEHREVPKEHATVEAGRAPNKRHRSRNLAEERRGQPEERTQGNCGPRKKLVAAGMRMTHRA